MIWQFDGEGEWEAVSIAASPLCWRLHVCDDGTFDVSSSDVGLTDRQETFHSLQEAKSFCESIEATIGVE